MQTKKLKTLIIYQLLEKYSDEDHPLSTTDLVEMLDERGIECERKSIYADITALNEIGCDIMVVKTPKRGYFMATRKFEIPEVMLLIDAVKSAGFITPKKTKSLVDKLKTLLSDGQAEAMESQVYVDTQSAKCDNEEIYIIIDNLHSAIMQKMQVKFIYKRRSIDVKSLKKHTEKTFTVSPYALIWKNDHYYLVCNNQKYDNLMNLRIDRMKRLEILDKPSRPIGEVSTYKTEFDTQDYSSKMFNMFSGTECEITLKCKLHLQEEMLDRFGSAIPLKASDTSHFETTVKATLSDGLVSWIMQYGADMEVLAPSELIEMVKVKADAISKVYNAKN
ncbi:MAG: WYL domain-containing transcriptional regulator [Eubacterium sp.]|nr:WYL domain-containing transcriptional regulator [Eubacterium sp.]